MKSDRQGADAAPVTAEPPAQLLIDIKRLAALLACSVASAERDDAAGRLPAAVRVGGRKRWRLDEIREWVASGCPPRSEWQARRKAAGK